MGTGETRLGITASFRGTFREAQSSRASRNIHKWYWVLATRYWVLQREQEVEEHLVSFEPL